MKGFKRAKRLMLISAFGVMLCNSLFASDWIDKINEENKKAGYEWKAAENWVTRLSPEERKELLGEILEVPADAEARFIQLPQVESLPSHFDWRANEGNWVTPVRDQGQCGSCWAFSATAQVEAWWKIVNNDIDTTIDLSEQFLVSCGDAGDCDGGYSSLALEWYKNVGVPSESCFGYTATNDTCENACPDWQDEVMKIPGWGYITLDEDIVDNIKAAIFRHPVSASYIVYGSFFAYDSGIYEYAPRPDEEPEGGHAILIVGWDDVEEYWICKNSWSPGWGENGYFRIRWHNCNMGTYMPFIYDELISGPSLVTSTDNLDFDLIVGDSASQTIKIKNVSSSYLEFSTIDFQSELAWHPDTLGAYDGSSWWCGTEEFGGYYDHWLQYLETPLLDLSAATSPKLEYQGNWSIEGTAGVEAPYDGWDGYNVWISTDGGRTFEVATPTAPAYNCQSLWSFGHPEQGWDMGPGIAGWGGSSGGWIPVEFDLSSYIEDSVIIRFAFASDMGFCSLDDASIFGLKIDNIVVSDGVTTIFEDYADDINSMQRYGFGDEPAAWVDILQGGGMLAPGDSVEITIKVKTRELEPGEYFASITFLTNDSTGVMPTVALSLNLTAPDHDVTVDDVWLPEEGLCVITNVPLGAKIRNCGLNDETDIDVVCTIFQEGEIVYQDTTCLDSLNAGEIGVAQFDPIFITEACELDVEVTVFLTDDYNDYNNYFKGGIVVTNLVDGFETGASKWVFEGGATYSNSMLGPRNGQYIASMCGDAIPYANNMDAKMTYTPGFDLTRIDFATFKFWSLFQIEANKDICYIEASTDSVNWTKLDSLTGLQDDYKQYQIRLTEFITGGFSKVWVRFHFVSDSAITGIGLFIDDVEIFTEEPSSAIKIADLNRTLPTEWSLKQNYPNPFNPATTIQYAVPENAHVKIKIYDISGREVITLRNRVESIGYKSISWNARDNNGNIVPSGVYIYSIESANYRASKKMLLMK
ncbi:T9SS type A sorting domain-containing protein [bacterium]|nr:T9SS type A sorting domain-containing protein [bacterium]